MLITFNFSDNYEACSEIIETLAFYPEHNDVGKRNSAWIIIDLVFGAYCIDFDFSVTLVTRGSYNRSTSNNARSIWNLHFYNSLG